MVNLILCFALLFSSTQLDGSAFTIERTEVHSKYGSIYILMLANQIVPPDKVSTKSDVNCLFREVKKSGIFSDVQMRFLKGSNGSRILSVSATPKPDLARIVINEISMTGFDHVDEKQLELALSKNGVTKGESLSKYSLNQLMEKLTHSLQSLNEVSGLDDVENPWITIRPAGSERVKLILSPTYQGCEGSSRQAVSNP